MSAALNAELALEFEVLVAKAAGIDGILEHNQSAIERERLFKEVVCAEFGGFDGGLNRAVAGDDDHLGALLGDQRVNVGEHVEAVAIGQPDIEQDNVVGCILNEHEAFGRGGRGGHGVAFFGEDLFERGADLCLVVDHEDMVHERASVRGVGSGIVRVLDVRMRRARAEADG